VRKTLLLADDSLTVRRVIEQTFADEPIDVVTVPDGAAALVRLGANPPDVLLADIGMPEPDGYELALHVRRTPALAHIPVILLTGAFDPVDHARARDAGCAGVLVKPFDPQMLIGRVRQLLEARRLPAAAPVDDSAVKATATEANRIDVQPRDSGLSMPDAVPGASVPPVPIPTLTAESKAAEVDDYFARLDRAFAALEPRGEGDRATNVAGAHPGPEPAAGAATSVADAQGGAEATRLARSGGDTTSRGDAESSPAAAADPAAPVVPSAASPIAEDHSARPSAAAPTLAGAFAALLAIEQGQPLPPAARGWTPAPSPDVLENIVRRVTAEIAEAVVRELAPAIVSDVAERLLREETARLTSALPRR
jgi:CheY-like chemotaxis protein